MEFFSKLSETQIPFNTMLQIGVDLIILALLTAIFTLKKPRISKKDEAVIKSFEKIIEETGEISRKFKINLEKRQELLQQLTAKLDQRIQEAKYLYSRFERLSRIDPEQSEAQHSSSAAARSRCIGRQEVLSLARMGLDASEIAKSVKRPLGEVELILNLQKMQ